MSQISGEQIQEQAKVISQVHRQLAADFHPGLIATLDFTI